MLSNSAQEVQETIDDSCSTGCGSGSMKWHENMFRSRGAGDESDQTSNLGEASKATPSGP